MVIVSCLDRIISLNDNSKHELRHLLANRFGIPLSFRNEMEARYYMKEKLKMPKDDILKCIFIIRK